MNGLNYPLNNLMQLTKNKFKEKIRFDKTFSNFSKKF